MTGASIEASGRNMNETLKIKLILCPIDFSEFSVSAYQHALSVAEHYQAKLVAQHIVELWRHPSADFAASAGLYEEYSQALRESGKKQLQEFVKKHTHDEIQPRLVSPPYNQSFCPFVAKKRGVLVEIQVGLDGFCADVVDGLVVIW